MKKILYIATGGLHRDGITLSQLNIIRNIKFDNIEMFVAAVYEDDLGVINEFKENNCKVIKLPNRKKQLIKYIFSLFKVIKKYKFDVIHVCGSSSLMAIELVIAKIMGIKVRIAHSHNTINEHMTMDKIIKPIFNSSYTYALACGEEAGKFLFGKKEFHIFHNGINLDNYKFDEENRKYYRKKYNIDKKIAIGHVGGFNYQKNQKYIVDIAKNIDDKYLFFLIGKGVSLEETQKYVKDNKLENKVIFTNEVDYVDKLLSAMDIMLLPSKYEGLPTVLIEWQANGLPCLVSNNVTEEANISNDIINLEINQNNIELWIKKIKECNLNFRKEQSLENIKALEKEGYEIKKQAEKLKKIYLELAGK